VSVILTVASNVPNPPVGRLNPIELIESPGTNPVAANSHAR
jgi:hypothetical protein